MTKKYSSRFKIYLSHLIEICFFLVAQILEIYSKLTKLKSNHIIFNSTGNKNFNFNTKYLFEYFLDNEKDFHVYFVINDNDLRERLNKTYGNYFINTNTFKGAFIASRAKAWISSVLETPYFPIFFLRNKKRIVYHIGHGIPIKNIALSEHNISISKHINRYARTRLFTHVLAYSPQYEPHMRRAFKNNKICFTHLGQPRNDCLSHVKPLYIARIYNIYPNLLDAKRLILYAPTWRRLAQTEFFPFKHYDAKHLNDVLLEHNSFLLLRQHPFYGSKISDTFLKQSNILLFNSDKFYEIMDYLPLFDKLITDYSSIYLDYIGLDRPIAFIPYDINYYEKDVGFSLNYESITPGPKIKSFDDLIQFISNSNDDFKEERKSIIKLINAKTSSNCFENAQFIKQLLS